MTDQRVGTAIRAVRVRRGMRQRDVAEGAKLSRALVSLVERGHIGSVTIDTLRAVASVLDIRIDVAARWRAGELDRLLDARHAALQDAVARFLMAAGWVVVPEVTFAYYADRGTIDLLAWHEATRTILVIEIKTELADLQDLIGTLDRKTRLAKRIARDRGWSPLVVATWLVVGDSTMNRNRVANHQSLLWSAFPARAREIRRWLRNPAGPIAALSFFRYSIPGSAKSQTGTGRRVRLPRASAS